MGLINLLHSLFISIIIFTICLLIVYYKQEHEKRQISNLPAPVNYLAISCREGRIGNQLWILVNGWSIARMLNRRLYLNCADDSRSNKTLIRVIKQTFPPFASMFEEFKPWFEAEFFLASRTPQEYADPLVYIDRKERYLRLETAWAQNAKYFYQYRSEVDKFFVFGAQATDKGEKIVAEKQLRGKDIICAHIRQTDFHDFNWARNITDCVEAVRFAASLKPGRTLIMFGDETPFMKSIMVSLKDRAYIAKDSFISNFTEAEDLYVAQLCGTFVATAESSSFSFWLGYFSFLRGGRVFYLNELRRADLHPQFDDDFPLPWIPINVINGVAQLEKKNSSVDLLLSSVLSFPLLGRTLLY